jgi:hypothetical protein
VHAGRLLALTSGRLQCGQSLSDRLSEVGACALRAGSGTPCCCRADAFWPNQTFIGHELGSCQAWRHGTEVDRCIACLYDVHAAWEECLRCSPSLGWTSVARASF